MRNDELMHYGVLGMKWGVRKSRPSSGSGGRKSSSSKKSKSSKSKTSSKKTKSIADMTDDELEAYVAQRERRLNLEKRYRDLNPKQVSRGKAIAKRIMNNVIVPSAEDVGKQLVKSQMTKFVNKTFKLEGDLAVATNNKKK